MNHPVFYNIIFVWLTVHVIIHRSGFSHYRRYQKIIIDDGNNRPKYIHRTVGRLCDDDIIVGRRRLRVLPAKTSIGAKYVCRKHVIILATAHNDSVCCAYIVYTPSVICQAWIIIRWYFSTSTQYICTINNIIIIYNHYYTYIVYFLS